MRAIDKPNCTASDVFECCISNYRNNEKNSFLRTRLDSTTSLIVEAESEYEERAIDAEWYKISTCDEAVGEVSSKEMKNVYKAKLTHQKSPGYHIYNKIRASAPNNICPFCGQRTVTTLDHYLPQGKYLKLVVTPINLIPACADCNKIKLSSAPANAAEQVLHPYFDSTNDHQWLFARVIPADQTLLEFYIDAPEGWNEPLKARLDHHFSLFKLNELYISHAAEELCDIEMQISDLRESGDGGLVRAHLEDMATSRFKAHRNSWRTAMYQALADSDWYCDGSYSI